MKTSQLLLKLKKDMEKYESKLNPNPKKEPVHQIMSRYNLENFNEIMGTSLEGLDESVDEEKLKDLQKRIDHYFNLYAPCDEDFKEFIKVISVYLTFIAKKPLHPPGIIFSNGKKVYKNGDSYYCTGKNIFIKDELSLCKYCVCRG